MFDYHSHLKNMSSSVHTTVLYSVERSNSLKAVTAADDVGVEAISGGTGSSSALDGDHVNNAHYCTARLAQLLDSGQLSDVTLIVGGKQYRCHRLLLANASSVLESVLLFITLATSQ